MCWVAHRMKDQSDWWWVDDEGKFQRRSTGIKWFFTILPSTQTSLTEGCESWLSINLINICNESHPPHVTYGFVCSSLTNYSLVWIIVVYNNRSLRVRRYAGFFPLSFQTRTPPKAHTALPMQPMVLLLTLPTTDEHNLFCRHLAELLQQLALKLLASKHPSSSPWENIILPNVVFRYLALPIKIYLVEVWFYQNMVKSHFIIWNEEEKRKFLFDGYLLSDSQSL